MKPAALLTLFVVTLVIVSLAGCAAIHQQNAQTAFNSGRLDEAASEIQDAIADDPSNLQLKNLGAQIFTKRGAKAYDDGQYLAARADLEKAVSYNNMYAPAYDYLGLIAFAQHDWRGAIDNGKKAAGLSGDPDPAYVQQAERQLRIVRSGGIRPYIGTRKYRHRFDPDYGN